MPGHAEGDRPEVGDGVRERDLLGQRAAHVVGPEAQLRDEEDRAQVARGVEPDGLLAVGRDGADREPAEQRGGGVVRVALDRRGEAQQLGARERLAEQRVAGDDAGDRGRGRRAEAPVQRDLVVHDDPPADAGRQLAAGGLQRRLETSHEPVVAVLGELVPTLPLDGQLDLAAAPAADLELDRVGQRQRHPEAVVAGAEVGRRRRHLDRDLAAVELGEPVRDHRPTSPAPRRPRRRSGRPR